MNTFSKMVDEKEKFMDLHKQSMTKGIKLGMDKGLLRLGCVAVDLDKFEIELDKQLSYLDYENMSIQDKSILVLGKELSDKIRDM